MTYRVPKTIPQYVDAGNPQTGDFALIARGASTLKLSVNWLAKLDSTGKLTAAQIPTLSYNNLANLPTIATTLSGLTNDAGYVTAAGARSAISVSGSLSYNANTGVVSYTTPTTSGITEGSNLYYTDARARAAISATGSLTYNSVTGAMSYTAPTKLSQFTNDLNVLTGTISTLNSANTIVQRKSDGSIEAAGLTMNSFNSNIEIGSVASSNTPYIDFHSSGGPTDFDARLIASGGSNSVGSLGTLSMYGAGMVFNAPVTVGSGQTTQAITNLSLSETGNATSRRAMIQVGQGWQVGQDSGMTGVRDFFLYNSNSGTFALTINPINSAFFTGPVSAPSAIINGQITAQSSSVSVNGDAIFSLEDVGAANTTYRRKQIFSSRNVTSGNDWLFRHTRPSDGATEDFLLKNGSGGTIYTTGNFNPGSYALLSGATFSGSVVVPNLTLSSTGSSAFVYSDANANNIVFRVGPSSAYRYPNFNSNGDLGLPGTLNAGAANFASDVHTNRGNATGYYYMGNANVAYAGFDGGNMVLRAGSGGSVYRQNDSGTYLMYDDANFWGRSRSWYSQNAPCLTFNGANTGMATSNGGYGAIRIQSYDTTNNGGAFLEFLNQNRYGAYLGLDTDSQLKFGGWSAGSNAYRIHHWGNCNPIIDNRLVFAGDQTGQGIYNNAGGNIWEPYAGAVISGVAVINVGGSYVIANARWRYMQKQDSYGNWFTVAYA